MWFASLTRSSIVPDTSRSLAMGTCDDQKPKSPGATTLAPQRVPQALPASSSHLSSLRQQFLRCLCPLDDGSHHGAPRVSKCARDDPASRLEPAGLRPKCSRRWWQCHGSPCGAARGGGMGQVGGRRAVPNLFRRAGVLHEGGACWGAMTGHWENVCVYFGGEERGGGSEEEDDSAGRGKKSTGSARPGAEELGRETATVFGGWAEG